MTPIMTLLSIGLWTVGGGLTLLTLYLLLLSVCAGWASRTTRSSNRQANRFVIMVPAHNEERLLPELLANLATLDYPKSQYQIHVVADNCTDTTAALAAAGGAVVHERFDKENVGKGCALQWLLSQIKEMGVPFDAAVILDADSIVSTNFLRVMDAKLESGARAIQAYYAVRDAEQSWAVSLRAAALAVLHFLRPQGRMVLGGSVGLKGNGMVFHHSILDRHEWSTSVTEDIEFHMSLVLDGERVVFAPDATVWAEIPNGLRDSDTQNVRWEQGRIEMAKAYVPRLLSQAFFRQSGPKRLSRLVMFDAAMEHLIPPSSIMLVLTFVTLALALITGSVPGYYLVAFLLLGQAIYLFSGMLLAGIPTKAYQAIIYIPIFLCWKTWLYVGVVFNPEKQGWVRTKRTF